MKFFIYSRKSVYTGKGESIENQVEMCKQYIYTKFPNTINANIFVYEDEGFSAKNIDRPQFQKMLQDIPMQKPNFLVCYRLDRISRNVSDFSSLIEGLNDWGISFVCIKEEFDTSKPMGKAMMYIASVFAQLERETIAERVRDNMLMLARTGRWLGGTTPTGYRSKKHQEIIIDGKIKTSCKLIDDADELRIVNLIFEKFLELHSITGVSKFLIKQGIKSRNGSYYSLCGIKQILQNPVYCIADKEALAFFSAQNSDVCFEEKDCSSQYGLLAYNKRDYKKKHKPRQSMDKWIIAVGKHKGCISGEKWVMVQNILRNKGSTEQQHTNTHNEYSLLSGLIFCSLCGSRMFAKLRSNSKANDVCFDYVCNSKLRGGRELCHCQNIKGPLADHLVGEALLKYIKEGPQIYERLKKLKLTLQEQNQQDPLSNIEKQIRKHQFEVNNLITALSQSNLNTAFIQCVNTKISQLEKEISRLEERHIQLQTHLRSDGEKQITSLAADLSNLKNIFFILSIHEKRILVRLLVKKIEWDGTDLHLHL